MSVNRFVLNETSYFGKGAREELPEEIEKEIEVPVQSSEVSVEAENFYMTLDSDERRVLDVLVADRPDSVTEFVKLVSPFPNYKTILEFINEKALDFYGETIINTD